MGSIAFLYVCTRCQFISEGECCQTDEEAQVIFRNTVVGVDLDSKVTTRTVPSRRICKCAQGGQGVANLTGWTEGGIGCSKLL